MSCCCSNDGKDEIVVDKVYQLPSSTGLPIDQPVHRPAPPPPTPASPPPAEPKLQEPEVKETKETKEVLAPLPPPPKDTPAPPAPRQHNEFNVTVTKTGTEAKLGLDTVARKSPPALKRFSSVIKNVKPGLVAEWNNANPDKKVKPDDLILAVNGECSEVEKMYTAIASNATITLLIQSSGA